MDKKRVKIKRSEHIMTLKVKTESNTFGGLKTLIVLLLIAMQASILVLTYLYLLTVFRWYFSFSMVLTFGACINVLSSDYHGQAKATWILFLLVSLGFGYVIYLMSDKRIFFAKPRKKYDRILAEMEGVQQQNNIDTYNKEIMNNCNYLRNAGRFVAYSDSKTTYHQSGASFFDDVIEEIKQAKDFIFIEFYIISDGVLLTRMLDILKEKAKEGVDVRIIYDDMGSHGSLKRKTKKQILNSGIQLVCFNRLVPIFNIALNIRDHRKIVIVDGKVAFTGGANLSDEYINEKRMHGYWKESGIKIEGKATDNLTMSFLSQWRFLVKKEIDYKKYINKADSFQSEGVVIPFVSGPNYKYSISRDVYINLISNASEKLYIMTPYFIPDESVMNLLINKARSGVDVKIILPEVADKKFVYAVSRNNAEKLIDSGVKLYVMKYSFVHSKVVLNENECVVGSINVDLRSFYQQFESAVYTSQKQLLDDVNLDIMKTIEYSAEITAQNRRRNKFIYRIIAGIFNLISPFM